MEQQKRRRRIPPYGWMLLLSGGLLVLFVLSFLWGRYDATLGEILQSFLAKLGLMPPVSDTLSAVLFRIRLPRILLAMLVGAALSTAGTCYQSVFQNPMAAPDILGASSGAAFGAALGILLHVPTLWITLFAFAGGLLSIGLVYLVGIHASGKRIVNLILAGVMISSLFSAGTSLIKLVADPVDALPAITYWLMGSLAGATMREVWFLLVPFLLAVIPLLLLRWRLNLLTLGDDEARSMGVAPNTLRTVVLLLATLLTAASVSVSGMIGWVGLVIPHLSRKLVGNDHRALLPTSVLFGALFLLLTDNLSRTLFAVEIPIGILTAFVGAPFFLYLLIRKEAKQ